VIGIERPDYISRLDANSMERSMKTPMFTLVLMLVAALATPVAAQGIRSTVPGMVTRSAPIAIPHIANTGTSLSSPGTTPLQQQMQQDYATQLRGAQQQLLMQNPSGLTRGEENISNQLNGYTPQ
jgi:hypothetical protein